MSEHDKLVEVDIVPRKTKTEDADLDITPMIDIVFLLLAFFVMCSKMDPTVPLELPPAQYGQAIPEKSCVVLLAQAGENPDVFKVYKGRAADEANVVPMADPDAMETEIGNYVESELSKRPDSMGVLIKAEGELKTGTIEMIKRGIGQSELAKNRQLFVAVEDGG